MKRFLILMVILCLMLGMSAYTIPEGVNVSSYDPDTNYMQLMIEAAEDGSTHAMQMGAIYETQRNMKIDAEGLSALEKTDLFWMDDSAEILKNLKLHNKDIVDLEYDKESARILATMVTIECGHCPIEFQEATAMVAVNRMYSTYSTFALTDTIYEVITAPGQYNPA